MVWHKKCIPYKTILWRKLQIYFETIKCYQNYLKNCFWFNIALFRLEVLGITSRYLWIYFETGRFLHNWSIFQEMVSYLCINFLYRCRILSHYLKSNVSSFWFFGRYRRILSLIELDLLLEVSTLYPMVDRNNIDKDSVLSLDRTHLYLRTFHISSC